MLEKATDPSGIHEVIDEATPVARAGRHVMKVIGELRKALPADGDILAIRDMSVAMERSGELLISDAKSSLDYMIAKSSAAQARQAHEAAQEARKLNWLAAFFFPLMTIAAIFGMNDPLNMLAKNSIWIVLLIGITLGAVVRLIVKNTK
jgi:hypothetical protein